MSTTNSDIMKNEIVKRIIKNLEKKEFKVVVIDKIEEVKTFITKNIPDTSSIGFGDNLNLNIIELLKKQGNKILNNWKLGKTNRTLDTFEYFPKPDYYLSSIDTVTDDGTIVNFDNAGNKFISDDVLPKHIIAFAVVNKLLKNLDEASNKLSVQIKGILDSKPKYTDFTVVLLSN